jgi:drug/metabolite transporter (DMT)-like permease
MTYPGSEPGVPTKAAMTWTKLGLLLLVATMLACGQVMFKFAAQWIRGPIGFNFQTVLQFVLNPYLLLSLAIYGIATLSWVLLLRNTELSKAYLVVALSVVLVAIAGTFLLREPLSARLVAGMVIILVGLAVALW